MPRESVTAWRRYGEYQAAYDAVLAQWPVVAEPIELNSAYGRTHGHACGPVDGEPLVLLSGGGATGTAWFANVGELSRTRRVYALDTIGDAGRSVNAGRPADTPAALMDWLDGVLDGLELHGAALVGHSYGAWLALTYALHAPHRVRRLALLDPTDCFAGLRASYRLRAVPLFIRPRAERLHTLIRWESAGVPIDAAWLRLMGLGAEFPRAKIVMPRHPEPERLRASTVPTLVLLAERSRAHDIRAVSANARRLMPNVVTRILPGQSHHTIPTERPDPLNRALVDFLR